MSGRVLAIVCGFTRDDHPDVSGQDDRPKVIEQKRKKTSVGSLLTQLRSASSSKDLARGKQIHFDAIDCGHDSNIFIASALITMYAKCGSLPEARQIFHSMPLCDVVSWNAVIAGCAENGDFNAALDLLTEMQSSSCAPNSRTLLGALKACTGLAEEEEFQKSKDSNNKSVLVKITGLERAMVLHSAAANSNCSFNLFLASSLIRLYSLCGSMSDARNVFDEMTQKDSVSWTALIVGYAKNGEAGIALEMFAAMSCRKDGGAFVAAIKACGRLAEGEQIDGKVGVKVRCLEIAMAFHREAAETICCDFETREMFLASALVDLYSKCGSLADSYRVFCKMSKRDAIVWTTLMLGCVENGENQAALDVFQEMDAEPDALSFVAAIKACGGLAGDEAAVKLDGKTVKLKSLEKGMSLHSQAARSSGCSASQTVVGNTLVDMYAKCGSLVDSRRAFEGIQSHNIVSWTALIAGCVENGDEQGAVEFFELSQRQGCAANARTFSAVLRAWIHIEKKKRSTTRNDVNASLNLKLLEKVMAIHAAAQVHEWDSEDVFLANVLIEAYSSCGSGMEDAQRVFDRTRRPNVVSWVQLMFGYLENGESGAALEIFQDLLQQFDAIRPDALAFVAASKACMKLVEGDKSKLREALEKAMALHSEVGCKGFSTASDHTMVGNALIGLYARCRSSVDAQRVFDSLERPDSRSWSLLIQAYVENSEDQVALERLLQMMIVDKVSPDAQTFAAAIKACGSSAVLQRGKEIHAEVCRRGFEDDPVVGTCLVDFYGKCGNMAEAELVFDYSCFNIVGWTALLSGFSHKGQSDEVFECFHRLQHEGLRPDGVTFLILLTFCSHAGLVDDGKKIFFAMTSKYGVTPALEHYHCVIDMLGRADEADEAVDIVMTMPLKTDKVTWLTLLSSCEKWKNVEVGRLAFSSLMSLKDDDGSGAEVDSAPFVLMANVHQT